MKYNFIFEDAAGTLTEIAPNSYDFKWNDCESTISFQSDEHRDRFLNDSYRIGHFINQIAHNHE